MKHALKQLAAAAVLASLGLAATAQTPPPAPAAPAAPQAQHEGPGRFDPAKAQERRAKMQERMAKRQAELKQKLALSPAQEPAWTSWTTAMKPGARPARMDRDAFARLNTPDRIDHMRALRNQRIAEMDRRADATKAFYAQLTPAQQKVFDENAFKRGGRHGHGHHGPRHG